MQDKGNEDGLSEYEKAIRERVAFNDAFLQGLGIVDGNAQVNPSKSTKRQKTLDPSKKTALAGKCDISQKEIETPLAASQEPNIELDQSHFLVEDEVSVALIR